MKATIPLGPVITSIEGTALCADDAQLLAHPLIGGVILFTRHYTSVQQLQDLVAAIKNLREPELLVVVDHEGGRVQRFREGFTILPPMAALGQLFDVHPEQACQLANACGLLSGLELLACDISLSFAPVLDINWGINSAIGNRSFHHQAESVVILARAVITGLHTAGMASVGKHFPGHGGVALDSHIDFPVDDRPLSELQSHDIEPYHQMVATDLDAIMPSHVIYSAVDSEPAGFSNIWLQHILRDEMGFTGLVISDDLSMQAAEIKGSASERVKAALMAGCDIVLLCNQPEASREVLRSFDKQYRQWPTEKLKPHYAHLLRHKRAEPYDWQAIHESDEWLLANELLQKSDVMK